MDQKIDACPECGIDLETGKMPDKSEPVDRRAHVIQHWGTDKPETLPNPEARARAEKVLGTGAAEKKGS